MLKLVFEWCRIHIKTVLAQHYSLVVFYPVLLWFTYAWFIQATPSRSAQVRLSLPRSIPTCRFSQILPGSPRFSRFSQVLPGSPRKSVISCDFVGFRDFLKEPGCYFLRFCGVSGISWENLGVIFCVFVGFRDFLGEPGCYFLRFCGVPGFPGRTWVETVGDGPGESCKS